MRKTPRRKLKSSWPRLNDEELLGLRLRDLRLRIEGTPLEDQIRRLYRELDARGILFKPHVWLSEEWFAPDGVPGFAVPFYLAHPRLVKLERKQMLQVEGGTDSECMRILRHEAGHALDTAFRLHFRHRWREIFGSFARPYPDSYRPNPNSRNHVLHLDAWYAQAHPAEDFAETFAVWLNPRSRWRRRYQGWPTLRKLQYVDRLMREIAGRPAQNRVRRKVEPLSKIKMTLREHYRRKRQHYAFEWPAFYDRDLKRIFSREPRHRSHPTAAAFLRRVRREVCEVVSQGTGVHQYAIDQVLQSMIDRCKELKLRVAHRETEAKRDVMIMLTAQTMNVVHSGYHRIAV
ncbi:MAG TPA: putative zinc-binding metallopeptidase [Acidobacteriota bacterium]|nr:putative zinc-binding metallopeptidase [Acidobacteriota bacterium]